MKILLRTLAVALLLLPTNQANAQLPVIQGISAYDFPDNMKNYSMCMLTDPTNGTSAEALMVGTVYNHNGTGRNKIHLIYKAEYGSINASVLYDNANFNDLRAVAVVSDGATSNAVYTIVCQGRRTDGRDAVVLIRVDRWGVFLNANNLYDSDPNFGLYPLHAIRHSSGHIYMWICYG